MTAAASTSVSGDAFDLIVVGSGFASSFFLERWLRSAPATARALVLERGPRRDHAWQLEHPGELLAQAAAAFTNRTPQKDWGFTMAFGGGSNCWWGVTPRFLPEDFELHARYGVGADWPIGYDDLEGYYCDVEERMQVAGPSDASPFPRSRPYPQPAHRLTTPERRLREAAPDHFFALPTARPTVRTANRTLCCNSGVCGLCPVNAKFTVLNEMAAVYADERVHLVVGAEVQAVEVEGGVARGVVWLEGEREERARAELVALGANGIFNPHLLLRSGLDGPAVGEGINEQVGVHFVVHLDGLDGLDGGTATTGHGYWFYGGPHRARHAAALVETHNLPRPRDERGKWRQIMEMKVVFEALPQAANRVTLELADPRRPAVEHGGVDDYVARGIAAVTASLGGALAPLPVEEIFRWPRPTGTEYHIVGTTRMGRDPAQSVVDPDGVHHQVRNLVLLGGSVFPTCPPANPTLTLSALALRSADRLFGGTAP